MATTFVIDDVDVFPNGTVVGAYGKDAFPSGASGPVGPLITSQTMTNGTLTFTGLTENTSYIAAALVGATWRTITFRTDAPAHIAVFTDDANTFTGNITFAGDVDLPAGVVDEADLSFGIATQAELDAHGIATAGVHGITNTARLTADDTAETITANWTFNGSNSHGSGDNLNVFPGNGSVTGKQATLSQGTAAAPVTNVFQPSLKVQRYQAILRADLVAAGVSGVGEERHAAIVGVTFGTIDDETMTTGVVGQAQNSGNDDAAHGSAADACGISGYGRVTGVGAVGGAFGATLAGRRDVNTGRATGAEVHTQNYTATAGVYDGDAGSLDTKALVVVTQGNSQAAAGVQITRTNTGDHQSFKVGFAVTKNGAGGGGGAGLTSVTDSSFRDDADATRSLDIRGAHTYAMRVETTAAGIVEIRRTATTDAALTVLVTGDSANRLAVRGDGVLTFGPGNAAGDTTLFRGGVGILRTSGKLLIDTELEIDGALNHDGTTVGLFGVAPVTRPTALTAADNTAIDATYDATEQAVLNNVRTRVNELETKLQSLGAIT